MRITTSMMAQNLIRNLGRAGAQLDRYQQQLATGREVQKPSDNPSRASDSLKMRAILRETQTQLAAANDGIGWLSASDQALQNLGDVLTRARELAVQGATGSQSAASLEAIADEVDQLANEALAIGNATYNGYYLFGGTRTIGQRPFGPSATPPPPVAFTANSQVIEREIGRAERVAINVTGADLLSGGDFFQTLDQLAADLRASNQADVGGVRLAELDAVLDRLQSLRSDVGARQNRLETAQARLIAFEVSARELLSTVEDVDVPAAMVNLKVAENSYNVALAVGARIVPPSLVDFLR